MEPIERKFYTKAKIQMVLEELSTTPEMRAVEAAETAAILACMEESREANPQKSDIEMISWFASLADGAIAFAEYCDLDMRMSISEEFIGAIEFETSYFSLSAADDISVREFWLLLCRYGHPSIVLRNNDTFAIEFTFDLSQK